MKRPFKYFALALISFVIFGIFVRTEFKKHPGSFLGTTDTGLLATGKLVIVGGAMSDTAISNRFIRLAGGADAKYVVIPTANADTITENMTRNAEMFLRSKGLQNVTVLHTKDTSLANSPGFYEPITKANAVWFTGGRQWRIADSYLGTATQKALEDLLARGGVIGGSSAGATIQGAYLARGDTKTNTIMMGDHEQGFGFFPNTAIDQHLLKRNRQFDLEEIISTHPELLGIGLDENTAIVVEGETFEVIGKGYVAIYDNTLWDKNILANNGKFFLLTGGDVYNWKLRKVVKWAGFNRGIEAVTLKQENN